MKKMIATLLILAALVSGNTIYANGTASFPPDKPEKTTRVTFENTNKGARLYIKDSEDQTLYSERIKTEGSYTRGFDLTELPENEYYFEVDKEEVITLFPFRVEEKSVRLLQELKKNIVKPEIQLDGNRVILSHDAPEAKTLKVEIYYEGRDLVYSEDLDRDGKLLRRYDLSKSTSGEYLFSIKCDNHVFNEYVDIRTQAW